MSVKPYNSRNLRREAVAMKRWGGRVNKSTDSIVVSNELDELIVMRMATR